MYRRFGSEVTVVEMAPRLIAREDADVSDGVREILEHEGIDGPLDAKCISFDEARRRRSPSTSIARRVRRRCRARTCCSPSAGGPNTDDLGLEKAGVAVDARGYIVVDDELRTNVPGIWALGDCNGRGAFTHTSYNDFEIVAANLLDGDPRR